MVCWNVRVWDGCMGCGAWCQMIEVVLLTASNSNFVSSPPRLLSTTRRTKSSNLDNKRREWQLTTITAGLRVCSK